MTTIAPGSVRSLLAVLVEACGLERDHATLDAACEAGALRGDAASDSFAFARLEEAARAVGVRMTPRRDSLRQAVSRIAQGSPVLVATAGTPARVVALVDRRGDSVRCVDPNGGADRWLAPGALRAELGVADDEAPVAYALASALSTLGHHEEPDHHGTEHGAHLSPLRRLLALVRPEAADVRAIIILSLGVSIFTLATPIAADQLVSTIAFGGLVQPLFVLSIVLLGCLVLAGALRALQAYVAEVVQRRIFVRLLAELAFRLPRVRVDGDGERLSPELVNRFYDVVTVQKGLALLLVDSFALVLSAVVGLAILAFYHPALLAFDLVLLASASFVVFVLGRGAVQASIAESHAKHATVAFLEELAATRDRLGDRPARELVLARADERARSFLRARNARFAIVFRQTLGGLALQAIGGTVLLAVGGALVLAGSLTLGQLVAAEIIVTVILSTIAKLGKHLESFYDLLAAADKVGHLLDLPLEPARTPLVAKEAPDLRAVDLALDREDGTRIVEGLALRLAPGARAALLGPSGSGKSAFLAALAGERSPAAGRVELAGQPLEIVDPESCAEEICLVARPTVLSGSVLDNLRVGRSSVDALAARRALEQVGLWETVSALPGGILAPLGPHGAPLSRTEVTRLALARAIARRPRVLLVDGLLDELDDGSRDRVLEALRDPQAPWALLIATSSSTIAARLERAMTLPAPRRAKGTPT